MKLSLIGALCAIGVLAIAIAGVPPRAQPPAAPPSGVIPQPVARAGLTGYDSTALSAQELTAQSDAIVVARVVDSRSQWSSDGRNLFTLVTLEILDTLKGAVTGSVVVAIPGGIDIAREVPVAMTYPGGPQLGVTEQAVLFLTAADADFPGARSIVGFAQGKFSIRDGSVEAAGGRLPLSDFAAAIRSYVQ